MKFIYFKKGKTGRTGRKIRDALRVSSQRSIERRLCRATNVTKLIRWGTCETYGETPTETLNNSEAITNASNKLRALNIMKEAGVSVPWFTSDKSDAKIAVNDLKPLVGRTTYHQGGSGFKICRSVSEVYSDYSSSHWLELLGVYKEWRVHVFKGEVIGVSRKTDEGVESRIINRFTRNHHNGWRFIRCDLDLVQDRLKNLAVEAVSSLGLDFGAVDIILSDGAEDGSKKYYVLEVNSAPGMEEDSTIFAKYVERFRQWFHS